MGVISGVSSGDPSEKPLSPSNGDIDPVTALRDSEALYHSLVETLPVCILRKDLDGRLVFANRAFCEFFGKSYNQIVGKTDFDLFPAELATKFREDDRRVIESRGVFEDIEQQEERHDGQTKYVHVVKSPVFDSQGSVIGTQAMFWDVTDRKRAEEELDQERYLLRSLMDNSPDNIYFKDAEGRYLRISKAKAMRSGLKDPNDAIGKSDVDFFPGDHAQRTKADEQEVMRTGESLTGKEEHLVWPDGRVTWSSTTKVPLRSRDGQVVGTFGISRDITAQKQAEAATRAAQAAAEAANRAKSDFLANMSHEIRTPMNAIIGMTELVLDSPLSVAQREYLTIVRDSGESLLALINEILDFSKIEAGKLELCVAPFDLRECVGDTMKSLAVRAHGKGLELACHIAVPVPGMVVGDGGRLRQILVNLVGNAIKFTDQGEIVLDVSVEPRPNDEPLLHFIVADTGIGIPAEKQSVIFDAFEQADTSTTRSFGGTGLGLTISARFVALMGGRIWVESEVGKGSKFHFTGRFPAVAYGPIAESTSISLQDMRVLVVDDNATNRRILVEILTNWSMRPIAVPSAREALLKMREAHDAQQPFQLVLTDAQMPDQDGFMFADALKREPDFASAVIMLLTSGDRQGDIARCVEAGISAYLIKPVKQSELFDAIMAAVGPASLDVLGHEPIGGHPTRMRSLRLLLAEDSIANQKLAVGLLERWGHSVHVVNNGREALAALASETFELVLMDVQMPEMDGLEATGLIRENEKTRGGHIPIVAMTAHAMQGDRERCLAAGMDGYVAKPVRPKDLYATIERFFLDEPTSVESRSTKASAPSTGLVDWPFALQAVQDDRELLRDVAQAFLEECPALLNQAEVAIEGGDAKVVQRAAHTIKGNLRTFGSSTAMEVAFRLESLGRSGELDGAPELLRRLQLELPLVIAELTAFIKEV